uniref:Uncharacterized protein n=1 Tax=Spongospora subterranea TaxID=70186 RepID=A0A0H5QWX8_9EUKA|eukprot:CRZ06435.1 hypothetical protein [Spongospora subterranea]
MEQPQEIGSIAKQSRDFQISSEFFWQFSQSPTVDTKYGFYKPSSVFNFDQVPLPFICEGDKRTVDNKGAERVWVRQPRSGYEKRQCTLHLTLCADSQALQPKPIIIFRGAGTMIMNSSETSDWVLYRIFRLKVEIHVIYCFL